MTGWSDTANTASVTAHRHASRPEELCSPMHEARLFRAPDCGADFGDVIENSARTAGITEMVVRLDPERLTGYELEWLRPPPGFPVPGHDPTGLHDCAGNAGFRPSARDVWLRWIKPTLKPLEVRLWQKKIANSVIHHILPIVKQGKAFVGAHLSIFRDSDGGHFAFDAE